MTQQQEGYSHQSSFDLSCYQIWNAHTGRRLILPTDDTIQRFVVVVVVVARNLLTHV
jgi:hypothetical protein